MGGGICSSTLIVEVPDHDGGLEGTLPLTKYVLYTPKLYLNVDPMICF